MKTATRLVCGSIQPQGGNSSLSPYRLASQHQFWAHAPVEEEVENKELLAESRSRYITFPGTFTPVIHYCRAPLVSGMLCQRQDRHKVTGQTTSDLRGISVCFCSTHCVCSSSSVLSMAALFLETRRVDLSVRRTD